MNNDTSNLNNNVALLNLWGTKNYGAILTSYGLQQFLSKNNYSSQLVRYILNEDLEAQNDVFDQFAIAELSVTPPIANYDQLVKLNDHFDNFIVGSDQIWRGICTYYFDYYFYLDFVKNEKRKIACAASFGKAELARLPIIHEIASQLLSRFNLITVREKSAVAVCQRELGALATHVIDPVFYLSEGDWSALANKSTRALPERFAATYLLDSASVETAVAPLVDNIPFINIVQNENTPASIYDWLKAIRDCSCLITDSFHGMCFGLIFNKPMVVIANYQRGVDRFTSILKQLALMDRLVDDISQIPPHLLTEAPFADVERVLLDKLTHDATSILLDALQCPPKESEVDFAALAKKDARWHKSPSALWLKVKSLLGYFLAPKHNRWTHKEVYKDIKTRLKIKQ